MSARSCLVAALLVAPACRGDRTKGPAEHARKGPPVAIQCPSGTTVGGAAPPTGDRMWCERADATLHGPVLEWFPDGQRRLAGEYRDGAKHGTWTSSYVGGKPRAEEHWDAGKPTGTWITWFADGTRASESLHREDGVIAFRSFRPDGSKQKQGSYVNGREHGTWTEWDAGGAATTAEWKDGVRTAGGLAIAIGIPECDIYISKYGRCIDEKVPEAARQPMRDALQQTIVAWQEAARTPSVHEGLRHACVSALDAARQATASMGCDW